VDTAKAKADQLSLSASTGFGSTSVSGVTQKAKGDAALVTEQSGIHAGAGGLDINVSGHTSLVGGLITSEAGAALNNFSTGTLTVADIDTHSTWKADTYGGSIGTGGLSYASVKAGESETGKALSAIGGNIGIAITDPEHQTLDISTIRRDTENTNRSLPGLPDLQHILSDQYKTQADLQAAQATAAGLVADIANRLALQAAAGPHPENADLWIEGGAGRAALHALAGAILGGVNDVPGAIRGAFGGAVSTLIAPYVDQLVAGIMKNAGVSGTTDGQTLENLVATSLVAGLTAFGGGAEGAGYAAANYQYNYLNDKDLKAAIENRKELVDCQKYENCTAERINQLAATDDDFMKKSRTNTVELIDTCSKQPGSSACNDMVADLQKFNAAMTDANNKDLDSGGIYQSALGFSSKQSALVNYDSILARHLADVGSGKSADQAISEALVEIGQTEGGIKAFLDVTGVAGGAAACVGSLGVACALGAIGAAASANHLVADAQQTFTGKESKTALVWSLQEAGLSKEDAERYQLYVDAGVIVATVGVVGGQAVLRFTTTSKLAGLGAAERDLVQQAVSESQPVRIYNGVALDPSLPDPAAGLGYAPKQLNNPNPNIANSQINGFAGELELANQIAKLPGQQVLRYADAVGTHGADVISVDVNTGDVFLWDSKFRSGSVSIKSSPTFDVNSDALENALGQARDAIEDLPNALKDKALENLRQGNFTTNTVGAGNAKNSVPVRFCGGNPC
jgi:filamentous hemagglutinin